MKNFLAVSCALHGALLAGLIVVGTLLSRPRMSYYAVDLFSSLPAGNGASSAPAVATVPKSEPAPKAVAAKAAQPAPRAAEEELPDQDTIRMLAKLKKKRMGIIKSQPSSQSEESPSPSASAPSSGRGGSGLPGSGAGIVADAGTPFPYPWYLKTIADKLDKQWRPPQDFEPDTLCQVTFTIDRGGRISDSGISKSSGDALFDQLALRAVLYSSPLPPLPNGFPDDTLKVHMKFVGKRM